MEVTEKLISQIDETRYLNTENSYRYRPIMRIFYEHYEKLEYWLYKEDIFNELKKNSLFDDYTIIDCERDLENLVEWSSLTKMQDTKNASTIEEFKNKKFRYQMTEYATEIERFTISLEEMEVKASSLEPKLFDKLRRIINDIRNSKDSNVDEVFTMWEDLNSEFNKLNENYQDFLKKFNEPKSEKLLQSSLFLQFKSEIIKYLNDFIKGYQKNIYYIKDSIANIDEYLIEEFLTKVINHYRSNPMYAKDFDFIHLKEINYGKIKNIFKWFTGTSESPSEGEKLMSTTDGIIVKITKYASNLIELHGNMTNRKEEYKELCRKIDKIDDIDIIHKYSSVIIGIESVRHIVGNSNINTDVIVPTYDVKPIEILLESRSRQRKAKSVLVPIVDKTLEKKRVLEEYREQVNQNKEILRKLVKNKKITLNGDIELSKFERRYIQKLLANKTLKESEFGLTYKINKNDGLCKIISEDGIFYMDALDIEFEGEI